MWMPEIVDRLRSRLAKSWHERAIGLKATSFAIIGVANTLVDFGVFLVARDLFRSSLPLAIITAVAEACHCGAADKLALIPANMLAWSVAVTGSYVLNSLITFSVESGRRLRLKSYISFVASGIAGLIANTTTVYVLSYFIPELAAKVCAIAASFIVNFSLSHFVVFRTRHRTPLSSANGRALAGAHKCETTKTL
jgi:putative flippase GtrA